jgi:hypothetical protein
MKRKSRLDTAFPVMAMQLAFSSWEVIARRTLMMAQNQCSPLEYQRMLAEKVSAAQRSGVAFFAAGGNPTAAALLSPWHRSAVANAKRLRRKN